MHVNDISPSNQLLGIAIGLALCAPSALAGSPPAGDPGLMEATQRLLPFRAAKHVILFIGDGMNIEHEIATSRYLYGKDFALSFHGLPYRGNVATWDVTTYNKYAAQAGAASYDPAAIQPALGYDWRQGGKAPYPLDLVTSADIIEYFIPDDIAFGPTKPFATDSASAGTALATGIKTDDGNLAWLPGDPADGALTTVAETLRDERGFAIGVVSTVPFTHATPAAFVSHNVNRNNYHAIASEILAVVKPEVVIGGGYPAGSSCAAPASSTYISQDTYQAVCQDPTYRVVTRTAGLDGSVALLEAADDVAAGEATGLFGLFGGSGGNFESPEPHDLPGTPYVARATVENPLFKDAVLAALKVLSQDPDGLFLMAEQGDIDWANHDNDFARMVGTTWDLHEAVQAVIDFVNRPGDGMHWGNTVVLVTSDHSNSYLRLNPELPLGAGDLPAQARNPSGNVPPFVYADGEVSYANTNHTNELVRLYGAGAGVSRLLEKLEGDWYPCTDIVDNTQLYHVMMAAAGLPRASELSLVLTRPRRCGR